MNGKKNVTIRSDAVLPDAAAYNKYYMRVSSHYCAAKWITLLLFTVYLLGMLVLGRSSITYENFLYLLRDFNLSSNASGAYVSVVYEEQQNMSFGEYKNTLAVVGSAGVQLYDGSGNTLFRDATSYKTPVLLTSERYMLLYDEGGYDFSVLTSLARVYSATADGAILRGAVSDTGHFAIVSRSTEAHYEIDVYDASFANIERVYRDAYITDAAFNKNGSVLAVLTTKSNDWSLTSEILFLHVGTDAAKAVSLGSRLPIRCQSMENGNWAVVCDTAVLILNGDGKILSEYVFDAVTLSHFHISDRLIGIVCSENVLGNANRVVAIHEDGETVIHRSVDRKITGIYASHIHNALYLTYDSAVEKVTASDVQTVDFSGNLIQVCEFSGEAVFCFPGGAYAAGFK